MATPLPIAGQLGNSAQAVDMQEGYAYVGFDNEFAVVDVSDKQNPVQVGSLPMPETFRWMKVRDNFAYLALENGLAVVDVSQPAVPFARDTLPETNVTHLEIHDNYAYLLAQTYLIIVDITNPDDIFEAGRFQFAPPVTYWFTDLAVEHPYVFATRKGGPIPGTWVTDVSNPSIPVEVAHWSMVDGPITAVSDDFFYTAYGNCNVYCPATFVTYSISNLQAPAITTIVQTSRPPTAIRN